MHTLVEREIRDLHTFFEAWYRGAIDDTDVSFARLESVLAPEFTLITSDGFTASREQLLPLMRAEYAAKPEIEISIKNVQLKLASGEILLATYEEHGVTANGPRATLITVVLRRNPNTPNGLEWVHIHEVRLPGG